MQEMFIRHVEERKGEESKKTEFQAYVPGWTVVPSTEMGLTGEGEAGWG